MPIESNEREKRGGWASEVGLGGVERGKTMIRIYYLMNVFPILKQ